MCTTCLAERSSSIDDATMPARLRVDYDRADMGYAFAELGSWLPSHAHKEQWVCGTQRAKRDILVPLHYCICTCRYILYITHHHISRHSPAQADDLQLPKSSFSASPSPMHNTSLSPRHVQ